MFDAIFSWQNWARAFLTLPVGAEAAVEFCVTGCANGGGGRGLMGWWSQLQTGACCAAGVCLLGLDVGCGFCSASLWYWEVWRCSILGKVWCGDHM